MGQTKLHIFGASGHGKVVQSLSIVLGYDLVSFLDDNTELNYFSGREVVNDYNTLSKEDNVIVAVGINNIRQKIVEKLPVTFPVLIHPEALLDEKVTLGSGTVIFRGAIVQVDVEIGQHCILNTGASVDHECQIGDYVHVAPNSTICGGVTIGNNTWVGAGSVITQYLSIGKNVMIGAGTVIIEDIPDNAVVVGNPGRIIRYQ